MEDGKNIQSSERGVGAAGLTEKLRELERIK